MKNKIDEVVKALRWYIEDIIDSDIDIVTIDVDLINNTADLLEQLKAENEQLKANLNSAIELIEFGIKDLKIAADDNGQCYGCIYLDLDNEECISEQGKIMCSLKNNMWEWSHQADLNKLICERRVEE